MTILQAIRIFSIIVVAFGQKEWWMAIKYCKQQKKELGNGIFMLLVFMLVSIQF